MVPSVEDSYVYTAQLPFFLVPTGYKSGLHHVAGAHLRLEVRKLGQGKGQPASVPSLRVYFEALIMGPAPPPPPPILSQRQSLLFHFPKKQMQPKRLGPWRVDLSIQSVALVGWDVLERRKDGEQTVAWGRSYAVGFTAWLVRPAGCEHLPQG